VRLTLALGACEPPAEAETVTLGVPPVPAVADALTPEELGFAGLTVAVMLGALEPASASAVAIRP